MMTAMNIFVIILDKNRKRSQAPINRHAFSSPLLADERWNYGSKQLPIVGVMNSFVPILLTVTKFMV